MLWFYTVVLFLIKTFCLIPISAQTCTINNKWRIDCFPETVPRVQEHCEARGCCFDPHLHLNDDVPWCFYPSDYPTYQLGHLMKTSYGYHGLLTINSTDHHPFGFMINKLLLDIFIEEKYRLRFRLRDANSLRYEVPITTPNVTVATTDATLYDLDVSSSRFGIAIKRKSSGTVIFNSTIAPLIYSDQFLEISTSLPSSYVYGLGERHESTAVDMNWKRNVYWARDFPPSAGKNLYGDHPIYYCIEKDGNAHGVFFLNSNAKEVVTQPAPALTWRSIGGIMDFYVFLGPTPDMVVQQYTEVVGRPFLPPMWSLGFHLCRWGYRSSNNTLATVEKMRAASIPQDVQWNDIDYMDAKKDFTYDHSNFQSLPQLVDNLHQNGQHYVMIIDPGIYDQLPNGSYPPYDDGLESRIFISDPLGGAPIEGRVWPGKTAFPDFSNPASAAYWEKQLNAYHAEVQFDGVWIDMNEPSNFAHGSTTGCPSNRLEKPPYTPRVLGGSLSAQTLCASSLHYNDQYHYNLHSLTGLMEMKATSEALVKIREKRPFVISRSTFSSAGKYGGHWSGDVSSTWHDLKQSISSVVNFNLFGVPMVGADICGFQLDTTEELCVRWMQLGAFYPFSRNHNTLGARAQAPVDFSEEAQTIMRSALMLRYSFLPYLYSLFYQSHVTGTTVARGLFVQFPGDAQALTVDEQFMWGSGLLISPVLEKGASLLKAYFPAGTWYYLYGPFGKKEESAGGFVDFSVSLSDLPLHARGGSILSTQRPSTTTTLTRRNPITLIVAPDRTGSADGFLYWDDGESLYSYEKKAYLKVDFALKNNTLVSTVQQPSDTDLLLSGVYLFNASPAIKSVSVNGNAVELERGAYDVLHFNCSLSLAKPFQIDYN